MQGKVRGEGATLRLRHQPRERSHRSVLNLGNDDLIIRFHALLFKSVHSYFSGDIRLHIHNDASAVFCIPKVGNIGENLYPVDENGEFRMNNKIGYFAFGGAVFKGYVIPILFDRVECIAIALGLLVAVF